MMSARSREPCRSSPVWRITAMIPSTVGGSREELPLVARHATGVVGRHGRGRAPPTGGIEDSRDGHGICSQSHGGQSLPLSSAGASPGRRNVGHRALSLRLRNAQADGSSARRPILVLSGRKWLIQGRAASGSRRRCATRAAPILGIVPIASRTVGGVEGQDASTREWPPSRPCRAGRRRPRRSSTRTSGAPGNRPVLAG